MKSVDIAKILIKSGNGGPGASTFHREKYVPKGGPDGGTGGKGGDLIFEASDQLQTLMDVNIKKKYKAQNGTTGTGANKSGTNGKDCIIRVPIGTKIMHGNSLITDLCKNNERYTALLGGKGGQGNAQFATPSNRTPHYSQAGLPGQELEVTLELKLLADVGLVGLPNAGKSTLLKTLTQANPKIASYPFTTLYPNLGILKFDDQEIIIADIPGLIEGASEGTGLGIDFLRHIDRTKLLVHLVSLEDQESPKAILKHFEVIQKELIKAGKTGKKEIIVLSKSDVCDKKIAETIKTNFEKKGLDVLVISSFTREGINLLINMLRKAHSALK